MFGKKPPVTKLDPNALQIGDHLRSDKLQRLATSGNHKQPPVVVLKDNDGTLYVAEGTHRAENARRNGTSVEGYVVGDDYKVGNQTALDVVVGIFFRRRKEG